MTWDERILKGMRNYNDCVGIFNTRSIHVKTLIKKVCGAIWITSDDMFHF